MTTELLQGDPTIADVSNDTEPIVVNASLPRWTWIPIALSIAIQIFAPAYEAYRLCQQTGEGESASIVDVVEDEVGETHETTPDDPPPAPATPTRPVASPSPEQKRWQTIAVPDDFPTIGAAMNAAEAGTVITVKPGRYEEQVHLKNGVALIGTDRDQVIVHGKGALFVANCNKGEVRNLTFEGSAGGDQHIGACVVQLRGSSIIFANCHVRTTASRRRGIACYAKDTSRIERCLIEDCHDGIFVGSGSRPTIVGNTCQKNHGSGIVFCDAGSAGVAEDNTCHANHEMGIAVAEKADVKLIRNQCRNNSRCGILVTEGAHAVIEKCELIENMEYGIRVTRSGSRAEITDCESRANGNSGINVSENAKAHIAMCRCVDNEKFGICVTGQSTDVKLHRNRCGSNSLSGIVVAESAHAVIEECELIENKQAGIAAFSGASGSAENNVCTRNGNEGIYVAAETPGFRVKAESNMLAGNSGKDYLSLSGSRSTSQTNEVGVPP